MRVSVMGQAAFGEAVLNRLIKLEGIEVSCVSAPEGLARPDPLYTAAKAVAIEVVPTANLKTPEGAAKWSANAGDLTVMAFVTEILPAEVFAAARHGAIQYHPSLLPLHRGMSSINWPIIFGAQETGITIFWPDAGIDTGPVLLQKRCPIGPDDTVGSLYFDRLFPMGVDALVEAVQLVKGGAPPRAVQDHALATNEPPCSDEHGRIGWHAPAERIYALIRGCNPQPGAWGVWNGEPLKIFDCRLGPAEPGLSGRILRIDADGFDVRMNGGVLRVIRVQPAGGKKIGAGEWAASVNLAPGNRFR
jgi:methionyl-tRNA formyltransferase